MKAVIPAAKKKESLFPFSESRPTALMPAGGEALVDRMVRRLNEVVDEVYIVVNYEEEMFYSRFEERLDVNLVRQEELSGTASAVKSCEFIDEEFLVVHGDVAATVEDLEKLVEGDAEVEILATDERRPEKYGVLSIENDRIKTIEEKPENPENSLVNTGIYRLTPEIFGAIDDSDKTDLTEVINENLEGLDTRFELAENYWIDVGSPKKLWEADRMLREETGLQVSEDAEVHDTATILGDSTVRSGAKIGPNTVIRNSTVAEGAEIEGAHIENSLIMEETVIDPHVAVEDSIIGEETDIKPGSVLKEAFIGPRSFIEMNNSIKGVKFVPDARTDLGEISK